MNLNNYVDTLPKKTESGLMIYKIKIKNFFSVGEEQEIDFRVGENAPDLSCFYSRSEDNDRIPSVIVTIGANASGKSTLLRAITNVREFILGVMPQTSEGLSLLFRPFFSKTHGIQNTLIEIEFDALWKNNDFAPPTKQFKYSLEVENNFTDQNNYILPAAIAKEELSYLGSKNKWRTIFHREKDQVKINKKEVKVTNDTLKVSNFVSSFQVLSSNAIEIADMALNDIRTNLGTNINLGHKGKFQERLFLDYLAKNNHLHEELTSYLQIADTGIKNFALLENTKEKFLLFTHEGLDMPLILLDESKGTRELMFFVPLIYHALAYGGVIVMDDLDGDLHPYLISEIIRRFESIETNPHGAQLIMSCHNTAVLEDLTKYQVIFTEKNSKGMSRFYKGTDIKGLDNEANLYKKYMSGTLGAVPNIG